MKHRLIYYIHSITGLVSGLFILLLSFSGALLVFHDEWDHLQFPKIIEERNVPVLSIDSCYQRLQHQFPHAQISHAFFAENFKSPYIFSAYDTSFRGGKESMQVFLHPQTAAILQIRGGGNDPKHNFMGWLSVFHNSFHWKQKGEWMMGILSVIFLLSITSGLLLYRNKIGDVLLFKKEVFLKKNLHQLIGVYALLFNLMIASTGFWMQRYVFKKDFYVPSQNFQQIIKPSPPLFFSLDSALKSAKNIYPAFTGYLVYFSSTKKSKTAVYGSQSTNSFIHSKKFADILFLDSTGKISKTAFVNDISSEDRRDIINAQIHYGKYGGFPIKLLYCLFGLSSGLLSITGVILWFKQKK